MAMNLFPRELTRDELAAEAEKQGVMLPLPMLPYQGDVEPVDAALLSAVVEQLGNASAQLHFELVKGNVAAPLVSVYVSGGHLISMVYSLMGAAPCEVLDPQQIKRLLLSLCANMPMPAPDADVPLTVRPGVSPAELLACLNAGDVEALAASVTEAQPWAEMCACLSDTPMIGCTYDSEAGGLLQAAMFAYGDKVVSIFEQDEQTSMIVGSPFRLISMLNLKLIEAFRDSLTKLN